MSADFAEYESKVTGTTEAKRRLGSAVPDWMLQLLNAPRVYAKQMKEDFRLPVRKGRIKQVGQRRCRRLRCDVGRRAGCSAKGHL